MAWSFRIGTIAGTAIRVHVTFALLLIWIWLTHYRIGGTVAAMEGIAFIVAVFVCVVLHEFGHIAAARRFGIKTPDITLLPIGGVARLERMPEEPGQEFMIAIAGPLVNVAIAGVLVAILGSYTAMGQLADVEDPQSGFLARLAGVNVFLVLFNMIPAFPMDGGRVLRAALASRLSWSRATQIAATIGQGLAFVFGFAGLFYNPLLIFIAIFVYLAATAEAQNAQIREVSSSVMIADVMITEFATLDRSATIDEAIDTLLATTQREFPVVDLAGHFEGLLTRDDMIRTQGKRCCDTGGRCDAPGRAHHSSSQTLGREPAAHARIPFACSRGRRRLESPRRIDDTRDDRRDDDGACSRRRPLSVRTPAADRKPRVKSRPDGTESMLWSSDDILQALKRFESLHVFR